MSTEELTKQAADKANTKGFSPTMDSQTPQKTKITPNNSPRRLMFVIEGLTVGGAEQMVVDLANEFVERGDVVHIVCLTTLGELANRLSPNVVLHLLNKKKGIDPKLPKRLRQLILKHKIDVVNSHLWTANLWTRLALIKSGVPVVVTEHNRDIWKPLYYRVCDKLLSHATDRLIAVSEDTANFYKQDVGVVNRIVTVVNNGVNTSAYADGHGEALRSTLAKPNEFLVGTVGRLAEAKNHSRLVEASAILRDQGIPIQTVIVGEGPERDKTESKIAELSMGDQVTLLGQREDIPDLLAAFDVFALSSDREGHPLSALEAQSAGTPVVLTDAGGSADAVSHDETGCGGLLVEKTAEALAQGLAKLASDKDRLAAMSAFAQTYAKQHYDKSLMIDRYSEVFDAVRQNESATAN